MPKEWSMLTDTPDWSIFDSDKKPTQRKAISQRDRGLVWNTEFGKDITEGLCPICNYHVIYRTNFVVGHKKALACGGSNSIANLKPICTRCNVEMGKMSMSEYKKKYHTAVKKEEKT